MASGWRRPRWLGFVLVAGCTPGPADTETDPQADTDTDADSDSDHDSDTLAEVLIPAGTFSMGESGEERTVTLTRAFWMQATEVTQADWDALVPNNPSGGVGATLPVERISWYDAVAYANALSVARGLTPCFDLSECSGSVGVVGVGSAYLCPKVVVDLACEGYRLPTEAEWEYAAQLDEGPAPACDGDANIDQFYCDGSGYTTTPVTERAPSSIGLYGMQGNVGEWAWDWYDAYKGTTDPAGPSSGTVKVSRGGGWRFNARRCNIAWRSSEYPSCQNDYLGLRLVRTAN